MKDIFQNVGQKAGHCARKTGEAAASLAILSTVATLLLSPFWAPMLDPGFRAKAINGMTMMLGGEPTENVFMHEAAAEAKARQNNADLSLYLMRDPTGMEVLRISSQLRRGPG